ncbi:MAG: peptidoglycan-N-acetylglucosamine deacetylase, partial [Solirubrobacteraceae bacterium]|nr:peptidoglycan-N-acetylglucosamine deacetylase [Solirubrobacteraceae bacterium]
MPVRRNRQNRSRFGRGHWLGLGALLAIASAASLALFAGGPTPRAHAHARAPLAAQVPPPPRTCVRRPPRNAALLVADGLRRRPVNGVRFLARREDAPHGNLRIVSGQRRIALSFDDGPSPRYTPSVLRVLARAGAHGTFFVIGAFAQRYPQLLQAELCAGNEVENHTWDHPLLTSGAGGKLRFQPGWIRAEIARTTQAIERAGAPRPMMFRPPYGHGVFSRPLQRIAAAQGELTVGWELALDHFLLNRWPVDANV